MRQVTTISIQELQQEAQQMYGSLVKAVVDVAQNTMMINAEMHADLEAAMLAGGAKQENLWGINLYPANYQTQDFIEFDSLINIRPHQNNRSRYVEDEKVRTIIINIVTRIVHE
jgi:hypothetical protein